jgi:DNA-binding CsgD family transcriptional regulator
MSIRKNLMNWFGSKKNHSLRTYRLSEPLQLKLTSLATREQRTEEELAEEIFASGLNQFQQSSGLWEIWRSLTPREQPVVALTCLGYSNKEIGLRMFISSQTVKYHLHNILLKYDLKSRTQLQQILKEWDFSAWGVAREEE